MSLCFINELCGCSVTKVKFFSKISHPFKTLEFSSGISLTVVNSKY